MATSRRTQVSWAMLWVLLLGQFALGIGYGIAAQNSSDEIRVPVCTSNGIEYIIWTRDGGIDKDPTGSPQSLKSGGCVLCTVSPVYLSFDKQPPSAPHPLLGQAPFYDAGNTLVQRVVSLSSAAPRAPPAC